MRKTCGIFSKSVWMHVIALLIGLNTTACVDFQEQVYALTIEPMCMHCHIAGGLSESTRLVFLAATESDAVSKNQAVLDSFLLSEAGMGELILNKVRNIPGHGGGVQLLTTDEAFWHLAGYIYNIVGDEIIEAFFGDLGSEDGVTGATLFSKVNLENADVTLRRTSILFTGAVPSQEVLHSAVTMDDSALRAAIKALMMGEGFHEFLTRGANDRLLTKKFLLTDYPIADMAISFPVLTPLYYEHRNGEANYTSVVSELLQGFSNAPLELIAYVVENDKPYTEILTADYTMVNSTLNDVYESGLSFSSSDAYKPGQIKGYVRDASRTTFSGTPTEGFIYDGSGLQTDYPHAGILNDPAFLRRYPSTATNRNRARSRWTYYHFLGHDIENSAGRPTDAADLNDTDNPTLNNPNCTVCHTTMDPVAGAFQNYGDAGYYRDSVLQGMDSLPTSYKFPVDEASGARSINPDYQFGDTWYSDMLTPGFESDIAPDNDNSLQWLAGEISSDDRFAEATVKFWWETVMGRKLESAPYDGDPDYDARLVRYEAQTQLISAVATDFRSHLNLKELLLDLVMSEWFRAGAVADAADSELAALNRIGSQRLLTPEELAEKLVSLTGYSWQSDWSGYSAVGTDNTLITEQRLNYGGIDSNELVARARDVTSLMTGVATRQALEASCPIVVNEFATSDNARKLLGGITPQTVPSLEGGPALIKAKLVELLTLFWNESYSSDDAEISEIYDLFVQALENKRQRNDGGSISSAGVVCNGNFSNRQKADADNSLSAWRMVIAYLMMDYRFLYE